MDGNFDLQVLFMETGKIDMHYIGSQAVPLDLLTITGLLSTAEPS